MSKSRGSASGGGLRSAGALLVLLAGLSAGLWIVVGSGSSADADRDGARASLSATDILAGADTAGFARAMEPRTFDFPQDHGPHPEYRTEWWYLTGNLASEAGREFGFQLTFFRSALAPSPPDRGSSWNTNQLWMAHFALTDLESEEHVAAERFARGAAGLAGGEADPFRVWLHDWEISGRDGSAFPMTLRAADGEVALHLELDEGKPPVLQGDEGWSKKGPEPGNASYYISWTRMPAGGEVVIGAERHRVEGTAWMDREWSTSALGDENTGWDWFSLQLSDGRELMFFELRREDGRPDPNNHGSLVDPDGTHRRLTGDDVDLEVLDQWASPVDGTEYPSGWRLRVPDEDLDLTITPRVRDQELRLSFRYWEGAVAVEGRSAGSPIDGMGYVELTGYGDERGARSGPDPADPGK